MNSNLLNSTNQAQSDTGAEIVLVSGRFSADIETAEAAAGIIAKYVIETRGKPGCVNVDFASAVGDPATFLLYEKWSDAAAQQAHQHSNTLESFARDLGPLLAAAPRLDLWESVSAHDLL